jgi:hypothetical protein
MIHVILFWKILHENRDDGVAQVEDPEFKLQYRNKKKKKHYIGLSRVESLTPLVELLYSKHKALCPNISTTKKMH